MSSRVSRWRLPPGAGAEVTIARDDRRSPALIVAILAFSGIVAASMHTLVVPILPLLPHALDVSVSDASWAITATLLAAAVATPVAGRLGDMVGKRRILLVSLGLAVAGSAAAALSWGLPSLIVGRVLQGLAAGVIPLGISVMRDILPPARLGSSVAVMSASLGMGSALGLPTAALVAQVASWETLFWVAAGLGLIAFVGVVVAVPESAVRSDGAFDGLGAALLSTALVCCLLPVSKGAAWGWTSPVVIGLFMVSIVCVAVWVWWELRSRAPLIDLRVSARRQVLLTNVASLVFAFGLFPASVVFPQLLQLPAQTGWGMGQPLIVVGLAMAPFGVIMMVMSPVSARMTARWGPKVTLMTGSVVLAVANLAGVFLLDHVWQVALVMAANGVGVGLGYAAMPSLIMGAVPVTETGAANGLNTLTRSAGTAAASAMAGAVLTAAAVDFGGTRVPELIAFKTTLLVAAVASLVAFGVAAFLPTGGSGTRGDDDADMVPSVEKDDPGRADGRLVRH